MVRNNRRSDSEIGLSQLPTEDISPNTLSDSSGFEIPMTAGKVYEFVPNWVDAICEETARMDYENAFYIDSYSNLIGIVRGTETQVDYPEEYDHNFVVLCHTHPITTVPSEVDVENVRDFNAPHNSLVANYLPGTDEDLISLISVSKFNKSAASGISNREQIRQNLLDHVDEVYDRRFASRSGFDEVPDGVRLDRRMRLRELRRIDERAIDNIAPIIFNIQIKQNVAMSVSTAIIPTSLI